MPRLDKSRIEYYVTDDYALLALAFLYISFAKRMMPPFPLRIEWESFLPLLSKWIGRLEIFLKLTGKFLTRFYVDTSLNLY